MPRDRPAVIVGYGWSGRRKLIAASRCAHSTARLVTISTPFDNWRKQEIFGLDPLKSKA
jgi:hypothetical protein